MLCALLVGLGACHADPTNPCPGMDLVRLAHDDFERPSQSGLGTAATGQSWTVSGAGYDLARIEEGRFTAGPPARSNVVYASLATEPRPVRIGGSFSFIRGSGGTVAPIALISSADATLTLQHMLHLIVVPGGWRLTTWNGAAQDAPMAEQLTTLRFFPRALRTDGTVYDVWMTIRGELVELELPFGIVARYRDPLVPIVSGSQTIWELAYDATSATVPRWESVSTFGGPVSSEKAAVCGA
jgi:hypothetical protein